MTEGGRSPTGGSPPNASAAILSARRRGVTCRHGLAGQQPTAALSTQAVAVAADGDDVAVVQEPVKDRGRDYGVTEHCAPLGDVAVGSDEHRPLLVSAADQLEEQVRHRARAAGSRARRRSGAAAWRGSGAGPPAGARHGPWPSTPPAWWR